MYGRTAEQELNLTGRRELNRHYYGDGRWGHAPPTVAGRDWQVVKHRPKKLTWAKSVGPRAHKVHAVRYQLSATHKKTGTVLLKTVWLCGGEAASKLKIITAPERVCSGCHAAHTKQTEVSLVEA
jgi:hypothetical protein